MIHVIRLKSKLYFILIFYNILSCGGGVMRLTTLNRVHMYQSPSVFRTEDFPWMDVDWLGDHLNLNLIKCFDLLKKPASIEPCSRLEFLSLSWRISYFFHGFIFIFQTSIDLNWILIKWVKFLDFLNIQISTTCKTIKENDCKTLFSFQLL